jgi:hypothetical protein
LAEYRQKLSGQSGSAPANSDQKAGGSRMGLAGAFHDAMGDALPAQPAAPPGADGLVGNVTVEFDTGSAAVTGAVVPSADAAGWASLDFALPTDSNLYEVHRFTTPRGDAELAARSISHSALDRLELVLGFAIAIVLMWGALRLFRRGHYRWLGRPFGSGLLIVVGLALVCGGMLPYLGLLALLAGLGLLVAHFLRRRRIA